jgi:hypothetical protein
MFKNVKKAFRMIRSVITESGSRPRFLMTKIKFTIGKTRVADPYSFIRIRIQHFRLNRYRSGSRGFDDQK